MLTEAELARAMKLPKLRKAFQMLGVPDVSPADLLKTIDKDGSGSVSLDEFIEGIMKMRGETGGQDMIMMMLQVNGLTVRVQVLEDRLDKLSTNVLAVKDALKFALDGIRSALYKAEYVEMRSKQLESAKSQCASKVAILVAVTTSESNTEGSLQPQAKLPPRLPKAGSRAHCLQHRLAR